MSQDLKNYKSRVANYNVVINKPHDINEFDFGRRLLRLNDNLSKNGYMFASIIHDCDKNDNGELKTTHYHYVIWSQKRSRCDTFLWRLMSFLDFEDYMFNCISVQPCVDLSYSIQYLTHKNNKDKYQYDKSNIIRNINDDIFKQYYDSHLNTEIDTALLFKWIVYDRKTDLELMFLLGVGRYTYYKRAIEDIRKATVQDDKKAYAINISKMYLNGEI